MKRVLLLIAVLAAAWQAATAQIIEQDGIWYKFWEEEKKSLAVYSGPKPYSGDIVIPDSVSYEGKNYAITTIMPQTFKNCNQLTSVTLPNTLTFIGMYAFSGCSKLASIKFPDSLTEIGSYAFYNCVGLKSIHIPANVKSFGLLMDHAYMLTAFDGCTGLESITVDENNKWVSSPDNCNAILTGNGEYFTFGCKNSTIPNTVKYVMARAFAECDIKEVVVPESVSDIFEKAFEGCSKLEIVRFEGDSTTIGKYAFKDCSSLKSINLPNKLQRIEVGTFYNCSALESIVLPEGLYYISDNFTGCTSLSSITINKKLTNMPPVKDCTNLKEIKVNAPCPPMLGLNYITPEQYSNCHVTVPYASYNLYKDHLYWSQFANLEPDNNVLGDLNEDKNVDVADLNSMIDMILDLSDKDMRADLNGDNNIDVADLNHTIDMILGIRGNQLTFASIVYATPLSTDYIAHHISVNGKYVVMMVNNNTSVAGMMPGTTIGFIPIYEGENSLNYFLTNKSTAEKQAYSTTVTVKPASYSSICIYDLNKEPIVIERGDLPAAPEGSNVAHAGVRFVNLMFEDRDTPFDGRIVIRFKDQESGEYNIVPCGSIGFGEASPWLSHSDIKTDFGTTTSMRRDYEICIEGENGELLPLSHSKGQNFLDYWTLSNNACRTIYVVGCINDRVLPLTTTGFKDYPFDTVLYNLE